MSPNGKDLAIPWNSGAMGITTMTLHDCPTSDSPASANGYGANLSTIRPHSSHILDGWKVEIFHEPLQDCFLARVVGLPGLVGRGPTEPASIGQLRKRLAAA